MVSKPPLGSGERFAALKNKLARKPGITNPAALAASIGRKKYGKKKMASMAAKGRKKAPYDDRGAMETRVAAGLKKAFPDY